MTASATRYPPSESSAERRLGVPRRPTSVVRLAAAAVLGFAGAASVLSSSSLLGGGLPFTTEAARRSLAKQSDAAKRRDAKQRELKREEEAKQCGYVNARPFPPGADIEPTVAASYPGSGARMTWMLVQALTGQVIGDDWNTSGYGDRVVTVKTHCPHPMGHVGRKWAEEIPRAVVLLRNPADAIPSFHNYMYEYERGLEGHSTRAPPRVWTTWRDNDKASDKFLQKGGFDRILAKWADFVRYWMDNYPREGRDRLTLAYEDIVDEEKGAEATARLASFLKKAKGVNMIPDGAAVECAWNRTVKGKESSKSLRKGSKRRPYTRKQLNAMVEALDALLKEYKDESGLVRILEQYRSDVAKRRPENVKAPAKNEGVAKVSR